MQPLVHGVDVVEIARIQRMLQDHGEQFVQRCFTAREREYADAGGERRGERYAARFACKEAVFKAIGTGWGEGVAWCDVAVDRLPSGQPTLQRTGGAAQIAQQLRIVQWAVSLSHSRTVAMASVIGWRETAWTAQPCGVMARTDVAD
jgi:holo-[acyl-carrier protein] synthase